MFLNTDNQFTAQGRLVREALVNISENGNAICSITLAQKTPFRSKGENETAYITYTAIDTKNNDIATRLAKYTTKGSLVSLVGYFDSYTKVVNISLSGALLQEGVKPFLIRLYRKFPSNLRDN
ncbi:hypothetical protein DJ523_06495 [Sulfolobus sp. E5]|nr:hypothetical protein DJ523_06495 [Sulfolobus sp. E5]